MFNQKVIISIISLFFLASCETATQDAVKSVLKKQEKQKLQKQVVHQYLDQLNKHRLIN